MIAQADSRKWMACLYNLFLLMEAKNHENGKETSGSRPHRRHGNVCSDRLWKHRFSSGCWQAGGYAGGYAEGSKPQCVEVGSEELANKAIEAATTDDGKFETNAKKNIKAALKEGNNDKYVWYAYFEAEGKNETDKAQAIANEILKTETDGSVTIGTNKAVNFLYVGIPGKYNIKAGDAFVLSMKEFTVTSDDGKTTTDWIMAVVTCKAVENK